MSISMVGKVGPQQAADGAELPFRQGKSGEIIAQWLHGRYYEAASRGKIFSVANQAAQAVSVALATTYTGLGIYNPIGSGKVLYPLKVNFALTVAPAAIASIGLITAFHTTTPTLTTQINPNSTMIGGAGASVAKPVSAATIATPVWTYQFADGYTAAALPPPHAPIDLEGMFGLLPGAFMAIGALTAVTGLAAITWEEVDL